MAGCSREDIVQILNTLEQLGKEHDYKGWDPFDGLNSRLFQMLQLDRSRFLRLAWVQLFKRSPVNFRPVTLVPKVQNAKAISLYLRGFIRQQQFEDADYCYDLLMQHRCGTEWGEAAWGYPFDWQAKAFFVGKTTPNVITTAYVIRALDLLHNAEISKVTKKSFIEAGKFVETHLFRNVQTDQPYFAYVPGSDTLVHNANLWACYVCILAHEHSGVARYRKLAEQAIATTLAAQQENGSWRYGTEPHHQFIDGFHTGYNLEALYLMNQRLRSPVIRRAIKQGLAFYRENCFEQDGTAKYYADNRYPIDPESAAQYVILSDLINDNHPLVHKVVERSLSDLWDEQKQAFIYQRHKRYTNRITYLRWTQAWMFLALSLYLHDPVK